LQTEARKVDWERIKRCLAEIDGASKDFLRQSLLIGGAACWFYRHQLKKAGDPDYKVIALSPEKENLWLSRDLDFTGIFSQDALRLLPHRVAEHQGRKHIVVAGVRLGFAQVGLTINPEEAIKNARVAAITVDSKVVEFLVADPLTLYFEKCKLCAQRGYPNDLLHKELLFDYLAYELTVGAEKLLTEARLSAGDAKGILQLWISVKNKTPEILQDTRLRKRVEPLLVNKTSHPIAQFLAGK
jgi:hypothetical protein